MVKAKVLSNICNSARKVYFAISTQDDIWGSLIGEPLHLTVKDPFWWHEKLLDLGFRVDWSVYNEDGVCFYGSCWANAQDFSDISKQNESHERVISNIRANLDLGLKEIEPHEVQDTTVYLLAGGPSLKQHEEEVIEAGKKGVPCVTVNGTYNWLIEKGIKPAAHVMVDAREFNKRFRGRRAAGDIPMRTATAPPTAPRATPAATELAKITEVELINHLFPKISIAEDYRTVRTAIQFSRSDLSSRVIAFTSSSPQEGKSATVANLAISFAQLGDRALVVDADLRKPRLHKIFKARNRAGLSDFLAGRAAAEDAIQKTAIDNLLILPSGPHPPHPAELLNSKRMRDF